MNSLPKRVQTRAIRNVLLCTYLAQLVLLSFRFSSVSSTSELAM